VRRQRTEVNPPRFHGEWAARAVQGFLLVALAAPTCALAATILTGAPTGAALKNSHTHPSPGEDIVGKSISLPSALFEANPVGSQFPLVTPRQSMNVAKAMWHLWETALVDSDTQALGQLISPGPILEGTINKCADPDGKCVNEIKPRPIKSLTTIVPLQTSYPMYFLSEVRTTHYTLGLNGLDSWEPWVELQILTKDSTSSSWKISFDSGFDGVNGGSPALLPFDLVPGSTVPPPMAGDVNVAPNRPPPQPADQYLPDLGSYWQSFVDVGHAPNNSAFVSDGYTSGVGEQLARFPQGSTYVGHQQSFSFDSPPSRQSWVFSASGGYPLVCGEVDETEIDTTNPSTPMYQNSDESNYGVPLAPGYYSRITNESARDTCVLEDGGGLDAVGDLEYVYARSGTSVTTPANPSAPSGTSGESSPVSDLETVYGVLGYELSQYITRLQACAHTKVTVCATAFATNASQQFARFSTSLNGLDFPSRLSGQVSTLNSSAVRVSRLFAEFEISQDPHVLAAGVINALTIFKQNYSHLIGELSS